MTRKADPYGGPRMKESDGSIPFVRPASPFEGAHHGLEQQVDFGSLHRKRALYLSRQSVFTILGVLGLVAIITIAFAIIFMSLQPKPEEDNRPLRQKFYAEHK